MNHRASARLVMGLGLFAGLPSMAATTRPADDAKPVDSPLYRMCAKCKPGSTAAYDVSAVTHRGPQAFAVAFTLKSVAADAVTLATTFTVPGQPGGPRASDIGVPATMSAGRAWPAPSGHEDVTVGGQAHHCRVYAMRGPLPFSTHDSNHPPILADNRLWVSDDVPGGLVKMQSDRDVADATGKVHIEMTMTACQTK